MVSETWKIWKGECPLYGIHFTIKNAGIKEGRKAGIKEGIKEGKKAGRLEQLIDLVKLNLLSVKDAAEQAQLSEEDFLIKLNNYRV